MIRDYKLEDKDKLIKIISQEIVIDEQDIFEYFTDDDIKIIVYDNSEEGVQGFSCVKLWNGTEKKADVLLYVVPDSRRKGIGTLLYNQIMKQEYGINLTFIKTRFRIDKDDATYFYKGLGYKKWYGRLITQFAINKSISKGINKIETSVVEWNARAFKLYQSLGFSKIQTTHYYQLVKDEI